MAFYFASWSTEFFFTLFLILFGYYLYYKYVIANYWKKRNVPHEKPVPFLGNMWTANTIEPFVLWTAKVYRKYKDKRLLGVWAFSTPLLIINDIELIKKVLVADFSNFRDHGFIVNFEREPLAAHLFNLNGTKWRNLRVKLTPTFTSGKMKMMFPIMVQVGEQLRDYMKMVADKKEEIEVKDVFSRFTSDIIASCAFGIETNSLKNSESELQKFARKVFEPSLKNLFIGIIFTISPKLFDLLNMRFIPKDVSDFFIDNVKQIMDLREKNQIKRNDFMQLLMQLKNKGKLDDVDEPASAALKDDDSTTPSEDMKFGLLEAAAQAFVFFLAGFETSATTMTFALYELAINGDVQSKLREEIDRVLKKHDGEISYEAIMEMEYLDWIFQETLRIHSPTTVLIRTCTKDYYIPEDNIKIDKGTQVFIPVTGIHWDPEFFPNPLRFDPTRFSPEEKAKRDHFTSLHFGEGPRICIGNRFAALQTKVGIVSILSKFEVQVSENTPIPLEYDIKAQLLAPKGGMHLRFKQRQAL